MIIWVPHFSDRSAHIISQRSLKSGFYIRVVTRYVGSGIRGVGSGVTAIGSGITDHGIGISSFLGIRDLAVPYLWDRGRKLVTLLESRIINLRTKMGSAMKKHSSLPPCYMIATIAERFFFFSDHSDRSNCTETSLYFQ